MLLRHFLFVTVLFPAVVWAGKMKEVYFEHERAVSYKLWGTEIPESGFYLENTRFVKANKPQDFALASDIKFYNYVTQQYYFVTCTTQLSPGPGGRSFFASSVECTK